MGDLKFTNIQVTTETSKMYGLIAKKISKNTGMKMSKGSAAKLAAENYIRVLEELKNER